MYIVIYSGSRLNDERYTITGLEFRQYKFTSYLTEKATRLAFLGKIAKHPADQLRHA
jgi:hypothetical protein